MDGISAILGRLWATSGFMQLVDVRQIIMIALACVLLYMGIVKKYEPLLLVGIAFGMLLTNLPGASLYHPELWDAYIEGTLGLGEVIHEGGLLDILYIGVKIGLYPSLIFLGVGAMTDFGPLLANPKSLLLGAAAQLLAPDYLAPIAIAAYSYMALIPLIQPPIMRALTTEKERTTVMEQLRPVSQKQKILFPIVVTIFVCLLLPSVAPLLGCLMLGNLLKETGVTNRLADTAQNGLMNTVTIFLSVSVGATARYDRFLNLQTLAIIGLGLLAFIFATIGGLLIGKLMYKLSGGKINPLIGSAGVSAVPMAARVSQMEGQKANPSNFLLMHAMGPNVAGVIGSAVAAGLLLALFG